MSLGWIWADNLRPLLEMLSHEVAYQFDDSDWAAFQVGLVGTDSERGPWFEERAFAVDGVDGSLAGRLVWTAELMRRYHLT